MQKISPEAFFEIFLKELAENKNLQYYYRFLEDPKRFEFRKSYFLKRLNFIYNQIDKPNSLIWDCGCGFATTAFFLTLNGHKVIGSTIEHYFDEIQKRTHFYKQYGDLSKLEIKYEDVFEHHSNNLKYDFIIIQDTLHHLEPLNVALDLVKSLLAQNGKAIVVEVNGSNWFEQLKYFKLRGFKKVIKMYDEHLKKEIMFGNENIRTYSQWNKAFNVSGLKIEPETTEYIRFYYPYYYKNKTIETVQQQEDKLWRQNSFYKKYFFFGLNFTASIK